VVNRVRLRAAAALLLIFTAMPLFSGSGHPASPVMVTGDLDENGMIEEYTLADRMLIVTEGSQTLWKSPENYDIDSFSLGDIDNDGTLNLIISLWKTGSFGEVHPFWHKNSDDSYKNHLFVYKLQDHSFRQVWCSSDLDHPILSFEIRDINHDGQNELVTEEGQYKKGVNNEIEDFYSHMRHQAPQIVVPSLKYTEISSYPLNRYCLYYKKMTGERYAPDPDGTSKTTVWKWDEWGFQRL
jgi:hypothetical protein